MAKTKNDNLYKFAMQTPWQFIFVVILYTIGAVSFPIGIFTYFLGDSELANMIALFLSRTICIILPIWLIFEVKNQKILKINLNLKALLIILPFLLVAINNFPILPIFTGDVKFNPDNNFTKWVAYALACLGGVFLEEITFRGLILPTLYVKFKDKKNRVFLTVFYQALLFGVVHLVNLLAGSSPLMVLMQIGYSFLIGAMCAIAFIKTGNFYNAVLLHFLFNLGGLLYDYNMISGKIWTLDNIILTAVIAVIVIVYALFLVFVNKENKIDCLLDYDENNI